jgi:hypothetical protein
MLRIDTRDEDGLTTLTIEGKLTGRWVKELEHCWQGIVSSEPTSEPLRQPSGQSPKQSASQSPRSIRVNLSAVSFIDSDGKELLTRMRKQGVVLVPTGCFMKVIVDEIESEVAKG